jgi:hypothetical protein
MSFDNHVTKMTLLARAKDAAEEGGWQSGCAQNPVAAGSRCGSWSDLWLSNGAHFGIFWNPFVGYFGNVGLIGHIVATGEMIGRTQCTHTRCGAPLDW